MLAIVKSEFQKSRGSSVNQFVIMAPVAMLVLSYFLGGGQNGAYNWWVVMFLPGLVAILSSIRDKILRYKGLFLFPNDKAFLWMGKILYLSVLVVVSSLIFMFGIVNYGLSGCTGYFLSGKFTWQCHFRFNRDVSAAGFHVFSRSIQSVCDYRIKSCDGDGFRSGLPNLIHSSIFPLWCRGCIDVPHSPYSAQRAAGSPGQSPVDQ